MPWMLSRKILRWRLAPPLPRPLPPARASRFKMEQGQRLSRTFAASRHCCLISSGFEGVRSGGSGTRDAGGISKLGVTCSSQLISFVVMQVRIGLQCKERLREPVEGAALPLERVHHVQRADRLPFRMLGVCAQAIRTRQTRQKAGSQVTESRMTFSRKILSTPRVSS
jgi:hypothetical protein